MSRRFTGMLIPLLMAGGYALAQGPVQLRTQLTGYQEVPAVSTPASGEFRLQIHADGSMAYELHYAGLEGDVTQSHIHIGQHSVNGAIVVFLCSNLGNGPAGTQACPPSPATISGVITAETMVNLAAAQGVSAGELGELLDALRGGHTYVNVHTTKFPGGEIRGQIGTGGNALR